MAKDPSKMPNRLRGQLLLASPLLRHSIFHRSVILIHDHGKALGAMGLILNQPTGKRVGDLLSDPRLKPLRQLPIHCGGPVEPNQLTFSSFWWAPKLGLRWAIRLPAEEAIKHASRPGRVLRAFVGYSGWSAGQLEGELREQAWVTLNPPQALLGQSHDLGLWTGLMSSISPAHHLLTLAPEDPQLN
ncbi:MAG TPA: YqgE/AlgH family protein [Luteolibacter sp.]|nr:YqgE/AlgH family protein [Luteolibacter sp.]